MGNNVFLISLHLRSFVFYTEVSIHSLHQEMVYYMGVYPIVYLLFLKIIELGIKYRSRLCDQCQ